MPRRFLPLIRIIILNVLHGDSTILINESKFGRSYGVIDSNCKSDEEPAALTKLKELGAEHISFIALTHPHADHYCGLPQIIEYFSPKKINSFYSFPLNVHLDGRLKQIAEIYNKVFLGTDSDKLQRNLKEFVSLLVLIRSNIGLKNWYEPNGYYNSISPPGFENVNITILQPPANVKGDYFRKISEGNSDIVSNQNYNNLSLAFQIEFMGNCVAIGGDTPLKNWIAHKNYFHKKRTSLSAKAFRLPHHGSKSDINDNIAKYIYGENAVKFGFISADGTSHPHKQTLEIIKNNKIIPYCTNLSKFCGNNIIQYVNQPDVSPVLMRFLRSVESSKSEVCQVCQGNIEITINDDGEINITPEFDHPCPLRGDFDKYLQAKN